MQFLHLAVVEYHDQRPGMGGPAADGATDEHASDGAAGGGDMQRMPPASGSVSGSGPPADTYAVAPARFVGSGAVPGDAMPAAPLSEADARRALLEELGDCMHRTNEVFLDEQMSVCAGLSPEIVSQVRAEVQTQLEGKVDSVLGAIIAASRGLGLSADIPPGLVTRFQSLLANAVKGVDSSEVQAFCVAVLNVRLAFCMCERACLHVNVRACERVCV
jgi:hypothetical protein